MNYKVGMRIRMILSHDSAKKGMTGRIVELPKISESRYGIEFDVELRYGHDCRGHCEGGRGHYVPLKNFIIINQSKRIN